MFNWQDLKFFLELSRQGRLAAAARQLRVDDATVSRHISDLERDLEVKLFNRDRSGFELTPHGERLSRFAERIEAGVRRIESEFDLTISDCTGTVRLASMEGIAAFYLGERLAEFRAQHPDVVAELNTERHLISLTRREADILLSFVPLSVKRIHTEQVGTFGLGLFCSQGYLDRKGTPQSKSELERHEFIDYIEELVDIHPVHWLIEVLKPAHVVFRSSSMAAQQLAAASGQGIALLPYFSARHDPRLVNVLPDLSVTRHLYLSAHDDLFTVERVRTLFGFLKRTLKDDPMLTEPPGAPK